MSNLCWYVNIYPTWAEAAVDPVIFQKGLLLSNKYFQILLINTILTIMKIFEENLHIWKSSGSARIEPWITRLEVGRLNHSAMRLSHTKQDFKLFIVNIGFMLQCNMIKTLIIMVQIKEMGHQNVFLPVDSTYKAYF